MENIHKKGDSVLLLVGGEKSRILNALVSERENIIGVLLPYSQAREERYEKIIKLCSRYDIPIYRPNKKNLFDILSKLSADLLISVGYPHILSADLLKLSKTNINVHPTLLPKYRGPATAWYVIADGNKESGVTVHFIDEGMDTGDIIHQEKVILSSFDTVNSLMRKTAEIEAETLIKGVNKLMDPMFCPQKQDDSNASLYPQFRRPEDSLLDDSKSLKELYDFIRACDPDRFPAYMIKDGEKVGIKLFRIDKPQNEDDCI